MKPDRSRLWVITYISVEAVKDLNSSLIGKDIVKSTNSIAILVPNLQHKPQECF